MSSRVHAALAAAAVPPPATPNQDLWVDPSEFQAEVTWLAARGYHAVTVAQWWAAWHGGAALPSRPIVFTFDDGFRGWYTNALPILQTQGWPGSMQLALSHLGRLQAVPPGGLSPYAWKLQPYMVREMLADGWELDSHSLTHPMLTTVSATQLHAEVDDSRAELQTHRQSPYALDRIPVDRGEGVAGIRAMLRSYGLPVSK